MPASPSRTRSYASARSGMDRSPLTVTQEPMLWAFSHATWSAMRATRVEIIIVKAPVLSRRDRTGI